MRGQACGREFRFGPDRPSPPRAGEHDIGADNDPKGVVADDRDGDKDANDPKNCHYERGDKSKTHSCPPGSLTHGPHAAHSCWSMYITATAAKDRGDQEQAAVLQ